MSYPQSHWSRHRRSPDRRRRPAPCRPCAAASFPRRLTASTASPLDDRRLLMGFCKIRRCYWYLKRIVRDGHILGVAFLVLLANLVDFLVGGGGRRPGTVVVMGETMTTPPRTLGLLLGRRVETAHVIVAVAAAAAQQTSRHTRVT